MIAYDPEMKESQRKQFFEGVNQLTQQNKGNSSEKQIVISLSNLAGEWGSRPICCLRGPHGKWSVPRPGEI